MVLHLNLSPELEARLVEQSAVTGKSPGALAMEALEEKLAEAPSFPRHRDHAAWRAKLRAWIALHPAVNHFVDDSRDSIYEGRGE
ncbi:MAG TPA: hypothetical protein VKB78_08345 [Pirellulales bacterium]|nr:hypothetical protein [Pirellulales bacterium]